MNQPLREGNPASLEIGTKSKVASSKSKDGQSIINGQVGASKTVSTADVPQLRINIDINSCIGVGKWRDPNPTLGSNPASISVGLRSKIPSTKQLPLPWLIRPNDAVAAGESVNAVHTNVWRMDVVGSYSVDIVVSDVDTTQSQSILTMDFDFTQSHEVTLDAVGKWLPDTKVCSIVWKADGAQSN